jgi:hypothetical protein
MILNNYFSRCLFAAKLLLVMLFFFSQSLYAVSSSILVISPIDNFISAKATVLFKGRIQDLKSLTVNGKSVRFNQEGKFYFKQTLTNPNAYHYFVFKGKNSKDEEIEVTRKVFYKNDKAVAVEASKSVAELVILSPNDNEITSKPLLLFKGKTKDVRSMIINNELVSLSKDGQFFHKIMLKKPNQYEYFEVIAKTMDGKTLVQKRKVFFKKESVKKTVIVPPIIEAKPSKMKKDKKAPNVTIDLYEGDAPTSKSTQPVILVNYPPTNFVTYKPSIRLTGRADFAKELYINNRLVTLDKNSKFNEEFELPNVGKYLFDFYALGNDDSNTSYIHKVFRLSDNELDKKKVETPESLINQKLNRKVSLDLSGADIKDVLNILAKKGDLNIISDKSLRGIVNVSLDQVSIETAIDLILTSQGMSYRVVENTIIVGSTSKLNMASHIETQLFRLDNIDAKSVDTVLRQYLSSGEHIQILENENILVIKADSKKIKEFKQLIKKLDAHRVPQIILEAQILEVSKSSLDDLGVAWNNTYGVGAAGTIADGDFSYSGGLSLETVITLLENDGKARILAKPRIKAVDREEAEIFIGDELPYIELATDPSGRVQESVKYVDSGINLKVKPYINVNTQEIRIEIEPEVSYVNGFKGSNNDIPIVRKRRVKTTVFVKNGNTVLIGGLFNSSDTDSINRFPLLSRIPILGVFFKNNKKTQDQTELVIAITPKIVDFDFEESIPKLLTQDSKK